MGVSDTDSFGQQTTVRGGGGGGGRGDGGTDTELDWQEETEGGRGGVGAMVVIAMVKSPVIRWLPSLRFVCPSDLYSCLPRVH